MIKRSSLLPLVLRLLSQAALARRADDANDTLTLDHVFFAIEASDRGLRPKAQVLCETWLKEVPKGRAAFFSDTAHGSGGSTGGLPEACEALGAVRRTCCPGNASLGASISTAQYKREHVHKQLAHLLLDSSKYDGVRWLVSTEMDAWFNVPVLLDYLRHVEANLGAGRGREQPLSVGHSSLGPFFVFNVAALRRVFGNATFMDACRAHLLECLRPRSMGASGVDPEACHGHDECHAVACTTARRLAPYRKAGSLCAPDDANPTTRERPNPACC